ncbi:hypothetical protein ACQ4PT_066447 [Festuca glaucescens]
MQHCLSAFLAEVYSEVSKHMEGSPESSDKSLHTLSIVLNRVFPKLEASLRNAGEGQTLLFAHGENSAELLFERLPEVDVESSQWTEALSTDAIGLIYQNLEKLDSFVSSQFSSLKKPSHMTVYWLPYTCGAIGLSAWLRSHSNLAGSSDMDNWIQCGKELVTGFRDNRVEKPTISLKELFQTFKRTDELALEQEIQQTDGSLRRMLFAFCDKSSHEKLPQDVSTQALMEIAMKRYMEESIHPIQNVFSGGLANAMLIQDRRSRIARHERTLLLIEIDQRLNKSRTWMVNGMEEEASYNFGLILYNLDSLYKDVESM